MSGGLRLYGADDSLDPARGVIRHSPSEPDCSLGLVPARGGDPDTTIITANTQASRPRPRGPVPRHKLADDGTSRRHRRDRFTFGVQRAKNLSDET
jgi:hypothetical protein